MPQLRYEAVLHLSSFIGLSVVDVIIKEGNFTGGIFLIDNGESKQVVSLTIKLFDSLTSCN